MKNNAAFEKAVENITNHGHIKLVTTERRRNYLVSEPNNFKCFRKISISNRNEKKMKILMNKPKILNYGFWYDYVEPK